MAEKPATKTRQAKRTATSTTGSFTAEERAAMKARAQEQKAEARANKSKADGERDVLAKIAEMKGPDRAMATRLHAIVTASAPAAVWQSARRRKNVPDSSRERETCSS